MAFNKAKALQEAEKSVSQGKISQAIKQYLEIAHYDPRDLNLLNAIGDLCVRDRNIPEALRVFRKLADTYTKEGFVLRAIAIYKKITKLDQNAVDPLMKLAELYLAQGLGREARELHAQALEMCQRTDQRGKALEIMRKIVAGEPDNVSHRLRMAEFVEAMGRKTDAAAVYLETAEAALRQNDRSTASRALAKGLELDDTNPKIHALRDQLAAAGAAAPGPREGAPAEPPRTATPVSPEAQPPAPSPETAVTPAPPPEARLTPPPPTIEGADESSKAAAASSPTVTSSVTAAKEAAAEFAAVSHDLDLLAEWESATTTPEAGSAEPGPQPETPPAPEPSMASEAIPPVEGISEPVTSPPVDASAAPPPAEPEAPVFSYEESRTEIDFYLASDFVEQAKAVVDALEAKFPGNTEVAELRKQVEERSRATPAAEEQPAAPVAEAVSEQPEAPTPIPLEPEAAGLEPSQLEPLELPAPSREETAAPPEPAEGAAASESAPTLPEPAEAVPEEAGLVAGATADGDLLESLSADLEAGWPGLEPEAPAPEVGAGVTQEDTAADVSASLGAMLDELEEEAAQPSGQDNPQTHYDLGVAFREMGLLDEAIGEFQKVVKAPREGEYPPQFLAACSLLGLCFMDKGMPAIAVKWFERGLESPQLDDDAMLALQYDLGLAYEQAGNAPMALQRFLEVYSQNIDYREVADKIRLLQQKS